MVEYIEREAAMRAARHAWGKGLEPSQYIEIIPAADVAPVVHCRHCLSYNKPRLEWCAIHLDHENPDDFCSYGKYQTNGVNSDAQTD